MKSISWYVASGQRSSATRLSSSSAAARVELIAGNSFAWACSASWRTDVGPLWASSERSDEMPARRVLMEADNSSSVEESTSTPTDLRLARFVANSVWYRSAAGRMTVLAI